jgi:hypothetical protein
MIHVTKSLDAFCYAVYLARHSKPMNAADRRSPSWRSHPTKIRIFRLGVEGLSMWDTCAVDLRVNLPRTVAAEVEEVQRTDPEMLSRIVYYAVMRRTIFDHLTARAKTLPEFLTSSSE